MKYAVVASKTTGNTGLLAETVRKALPEEDTLWFGEPDESALEADMIFVGFWTEEGIADHAALSFLEKLEGKEVFLFGSAGWGDSDYFRGVLRKTSEKLKRTVTVAGTFMCQGKMGAAVRARYEKIPDKEKAELLLDNFDRALTHPDEKDLQRLTNTVKALI